MMRQQPACTSAIDLGHDAHWLQQTGHQPITLMGGGTSMVGDPSFRDEQRQLLNEESIARNIEGIKKSSDGYCATVTARTTR
jgi:tyrosyl-tRNA synthetase